MTAPLHAAIATPLPLHCRQVDPRQVDPRQADPRRAAVAAHPSSGRPGRDRREAVLADLLDQAYLFDDPAAYEAGVRDAYERFAVGAMTG